MLDWGWTTARDPKWKILQHRITLSSIRWVPNCSPLWCTKKVLLQPAVTVPSAGCTSHKQSVRRRGRKHLAFENIPSYTTRCPNRCLLFTAQLMALRISSFGTKKRITICHKVLDAIWWTKRPADFVVFVHKSWEKCTFCLIYLRLWSDTTPSHGMVQYCVILSFSPNSCFLETSSSWS